MTLFTVRQQTSTTHHLHPTEAPRPLEVRPDPAAGVLLAPDGQEIVAPQGVREGDLQGAAGEATTTHPQPMDHPMGHPMDRLMDHPMDLPMDQPMDCPMDHLVPQDHLHHPQLDPPMVPLFTETLTITCTLGLCLPLFTHLHHPLLAILHPLVIRTLLL